MMTHNYSHMGFKLVKGFYSKKELSTIRPIIDKFHQSWLRDNQAFYKSHAINSSGITASRYLSEHEKLQLFQFIASDKLVKEVTAITASPQFVNTQLFFNPANIKQKNYWHRDCQYGNDIDAQKAILAGPEALHCRIALEDEPGIEVIPASYKSWDSKEQLNVRLEQNGRHASDNLTDGVSLPLKQGDMLIFSANLIHRGLYGMNRFAFDVLYCQRHPAMSQFIQTDFLPTKAQLSQLKNRYVFEK